MAGRLSASLAENVMHRTVVTMFIIVWVIGLQHYTCQAQNSAVGTIRVEGRFMTDSFKVGMPLQYTLTALYPSEYNIIFPDSAFKYAPFEYVDRKYVPTRTVGNMSFDSVIYFLQTFETDSVIKYQLPVAWISKQDTLPIDAAADSIFYSPVIKSDSLHQEVLSNLNYHDVALSINYPFILLFLLALVILIVLINYLFGKPIQRYIQLLLLRRRHHAFKTQYLKLMQRLRLQATVSTMEQLLGLWKKYIERLEKVPYSTFTTKEIGQHTRNQQLLEALRAIDIWVYGGIVPDNYMKGVEYMLLVAEEFYIRKRNDLKNAGKL